MMTNRWFRLTSATLAIFLTSSVYYGWQPFSLLLFRSGAYEWLCTPETTITGESYLCEAQFAAVGGLYTLGSSLGFCGTLVAGIIYDNLGPRVCGWVGEILFVLGYGLIGVSSPSLRLYVPGFIFAGLSGAFVCFPVFVLGEVWPRQAKLIMAHSMAVQLLTSFVAPVMVSLQDATGLSFAAIMTGYVALSIPSALLYCLSLPSSRAEIRAEMGDSAYELSEETTGWNGFFRLLLTVEWVTCLFWYVVQIMLFNSYNVNLRAVSGDAVATFMGWAVPFEGVTGLLWGVLNTYITTLWICISMTLMNIAMLSTTFAPPGPLHYVGVLLFVVSNSHIYTTKYTYMSEIFDSEHFGKLSGSIGFTAGVLQLLNIIIDKFSPPHRVLFGAWIGVAFVSLLAISSMQVRQRRGINYKIEVVSSGSLAATSETSV